MTPRADTDTATRILDVAERLVQVRGFNAFSYADVAAELQITKAALHYHFASKADLGSALVARYTGDFIDALEGIDRTDGSAMQKQLWAIGAILFSTALYIMGNGLIGVLIPVRATHAGF